MNRVDSLQANREEKQTLIPTRLIPALGGSRKKEKKASEGRLVAIGARFMPLVAMLVMAGFGVGSMAVPRTMALFADLEESVGNLFSAGDLDFELDATAWEPAATASSMTPGAVVARDVDVLKIGSSDFQYFVTANNITGDAAFCGALILGAELHATSVYTGPISGFVSSGPYIFSDPEPWSYTAGVATSTILIPGQVCEFDFVYNATQAGTSTSGFTRTRTLHNMLTSGTSSEPVSDELAPVYDTYISQHEPDANHGDSDHLEVASKQDKNSRTFIKFKFQLPPGTQVLFSELKMFMSHKPSSPRNLEVKRVLGGWTEHNLIWNNQPGAAAGATDVTTAPTTNNVWLAWDVTSDVAGFTDGSLANRGWRLSDETENSISTKQETFRSREDDIEEEHDVPVNRRPALEVVFKPPLIYTDHVVINEVYSRVDEENRGDDPENEWVELYNPTDNPVNVSGFKICDATACDTLPGATIMAAKGFVLISREAQTWGYWPAIPTGTLKLVLGSEIGNGLSNANDAVILRNASNTIVDAMNYGAVTIYHPAMTNVKEGNSFARVIKGYDNNSATDWIENRSPNPGTNPSEGGMEIMRFTDEGVEVAAFAAGLLRLYDPAKDGIYHTMEEEVYEEVDDGEEPVSVSLPEENGGGSSAPLVLSVPAETPDAEAPTSTSSSSDPADAPSEPEATSTVMGTEAVTSNSGEADKQGGGSKDQLRAERQMSEDPSAGTGGAEEGQAGVQEPRASQVKSQEEASGTEEAGTVKPAEASTQTSHQAESASDGEQSNSR